MDGSTPPGATPRCVAELGSRARHRRAAPTAGRASTPWRPARMRPDQPPAGGPRPGGHARQRPPFLQLGPGIDHLPAHRLAAGRAVAAPRRSGRADRGAVRGHGRRRPGGRGGRLAARPAGLSAPPARRSGTARCWPTSRRACRWRPRAPRRSGGPGRSPGASGCGGGGTPGSPGTGRPRTHSPLSPPLTGGDWSRPSTLTDSSVPSTTGWATISLSCWTSTATTPIDATVARRCATAIGASEPTGSSGPPGRDRRRRVGGADLPAAQRRRQRRRDAAATVCVAWAKPPWTRDWLTPEPPFGVATPAGRRGVTSVDGPAPDRSAWARSRWAGRHG